MKLSNLFSGLTAAAAVVASSHGQGTFQNLDFESARLVPIGDSQFVATTNALPGWTALAGTNQLLSIPYLASFGVSVGLVATSHMVIDGSFSVSLNGYYPNVTASIRQTGLVPADAKSLLFKVRYNPAVASETAEIVSLGGQNLPLLALSGGPKYSTVVYGADISSFSGQTETLSFYSIYASSQDAPSFILDDIQFSPQGIPEPSTISLMLVAGAVLISRRRKPWGRCQRVQESRRRPIS